MVSINATRPITIIATENLNWMCRVDDDIAIATSDGNNFFSNQLESPMYVDIFTYKNSSNLVIPVINFSACFSIFLLGEDKGSVIGVD